MAARIERIDCHMVPLHDDAGIKSMGAAIPQGDKLISSCCLAKIYKIERIPFTNVLYASFALTGVGVDSLDQSYKSQDSSSESQKLDTKNQNDVVQWHTTYLPSEHFKC